MNNAFIIILILTIFCLIVIDFAWKIHDKIDYVAEILNEEVD